MISELTLVVLAQCDTELHVTPSSPRKPRAEATRDWLKVEPISFNQLKSERVGNEPLFCGPFFPFSATKSRGPNLDREMS